MCTKNLLFTAVWMITEEVAKANAEQYSLVIIVYAGMEYYAAIKKNKADLLVPI